MLTDASVTVAITLITKRHHDNIIYAYAVDPMNILAHLTVYLIPNPIQMIHPNRIANRPIVQPFELYAHDHILRHNINL